MAIVGDELFVAETEADQVAALSLKGQRKRTLRAKRAYGLHAPQGVAALRHLDAPLLVLACRSCAIVMDVNGSIMQRALDFTRQLGQVVCDESHVYVCESGEDKLSESGRVWQLKLW